MTSEPRGTPATGLQPAAAPHRVLAVSHRLTAVAAAAGGILTFILALQLLKQGAAGLALLLHRIAAEGLVNTLGLGWLMAYLAMSGSPVAATALTLLDGGALSPLETFGMINGSRLGASFIVLLNGFVYYLRGIRGRGVVAMGVLSMVTTATTYLPAMVLGAAVLRAGWLDGVRFAVPGLASVIDLVYGPITRSAALYLPDLLTFVLGFGCLLLAFQVFDRALPGVGTDVLETWWGRLFNSPLTTFLLGLFVTSVTLSVSVALGILVPLAGRGYIRKDQVVPYIMGANISTFVDTLAASLLLNNPSAFVIVLVEMVSVALTSLVILVFAYRRYRDALMEANRWVTSSRLRFTVFVALLALIPLGLLLV